LTHEGHVVEKVYDGVAALEILNESLFDLVILDVMLPKQDGFQVLETLRETSQIPVILLTARTLEADKLVGFGFGADDYLTKPFSLRELSLRIRAILRRTGTAQGKESITWGNLLLDPEKMSVTVNRVPIDLTKAEFQILFTLVSRPGKVFTREELIRAAFGEDYSAYERTIDTHIWNLRRKIEKEPTNPVYIVTVRGVGYKCGGFGMDG
jgi:two-component system OmpR family response regulator